MDYRNKIISWLAESECERVCRKTIRALQKITEGMQSGDDTPLKNIWDEICVQVQHEHSFFWDLYLDMVRNIVLDEVKKLETVVKEAIWLQSNEGNDWELQRKIETEIEEEGERDELEKTRSRVQFIFDRIVFEATDYIGENVVSIKVDKLKAAVEQAIWIRTRWVMNWYNERENEIDFKREEFEKVQRFLDDIDEIAGYFVNDILSEASDISNSGLVSIQLDKLRTSIKETNKNGNWYGERRIEGKVDRKELKEVPYSDYEIAEYILGSILRKAADWKNTRIEKYLY